MMSKAVLYMSMSLDGFIAGPNVAPGNGQGEPLFGDLPPDRVELELLRALDGRGVQHLRYLVRSEG